MAGPILFLDIDGVLLPGNALYSSKNPRHLPKEKIALLNEVVAETGVDIVVSSTWRLDEDCRERLVRAGFRGRFHEDWRTRRWWDLQEVYGDAWRQDAPSRGSEIADWLKRHPEVACWVILDDDSDMLPEQLERFVKTEFRTGLCRGHIEVMIEMMGPPANVPGVR